MFYMGFRRRWHWSKAFWDMMMCGTEYMSERVPDWQSQVMASTGIGQKVKQLEWQVQFVIQEANDPVQPAWKQSLVITQGCGLRVSLEWAGSKSECKGWHGYANCLGYMLPAVYMTIFVWTARPRFCKYSGRKIGFFIFKEHQCCFHIKDRQVFYRQQNKMPNICICFTLS